MSRPSLIAILLIFNSLIAYVIVFKLYSFPGIPRYLRGIAVNLVQGSLVCVQNSQICSVLTTWKIRVMNQHVKIMTWISHCEKNDLQVVDTSS